MRRRAAFFVDDFEQYMAGVWMVLLHPNVHRFSEDQQREVVGAMLPARRRHHRLLVPTQHPTDTLEIRDPAEPLFQLRERVRHGRQITA